MKQPSTQVHTIFGPPGTGKTRKLVDIAKREARPESPSLFLSFTKAAAAEAVSRLPNASFIQTSTMHSMAFQSLGLTKASVVDSRKLYEFGVHAGFPFKGSERGSDEPQEGDEYSNVLQFANNQLIAPDVAYDRLGRPGTRARFTMFVEAYQAWKKVYGHLDFDDMLRIFVEQERPGRSYHAIFLDEAQDCSPLQWTVMEKLRKQAAHVYIAGDDDQAIYEWSGADPHGMVDFKDRHRGTMEVLNQSHRVPRVVHEMVHNKLLREIKRRVYKKFDPTDGEGSITRYGDFTNVDLSQFSGLILVRDRWREDEVKRALNRELIPYDVWGGSSPWTSRIAQALKRGETPEIPLLWREFYRQADLSLPVAIHVATIHQAKGRESDRVLLDLTLPSRVEQNLYANRDAELRVMYVACTRTANELLLCGGNQLL